MTRETMIKIVIPINIYAWLFHLFRLISKSWHILWCYRCSWWCKQEESWRWSKVVADSFLLEGDHCSLIFCFPSLFVFYAFRSLSVWCFCFHCFVFFCLCFIVFLLSFFLSLIFICVSFCLSGFRMSQRTLEYCARIYVWRQQSVLFSVHLFGRLWTSESEETFRTSEQIINCNEHTVVGQISFEGDTHTNDYQCS